MRRALAIREKVQGPNHVEVATSLAFLSQIEVANGHYGESESL